jgi:hypothetical protein
MREYWDDMWRLFDILAYLVKSTDEDGIDMYFTMTEKKHNSKDYGGTSGLVKIVKERKNTLEGSSNINGRLDQVLGEYCRALTNEVDLRRSRSRFAPAEDRKPLSVYVFTNALWSKRSDPQSTIKAVVDKLKELGYPSWQVGIQFISFGENPEALKRLEHYDTGLGLDMYVSRAVVGREWGADMN